MKKQYYDMVIIPSMSMLHGRRVFGFRILELRY
jgi:hypothetical protein